MCEHRFLDHPDGLPCTRQDVHTTGHTYESSTGSAVPDRHTEAPND